MKPLVRFAAGLTALTGVALTACQKGPSQVKLKLLSPDAISSDDWSTAKEENNYSSSCAIDGTVVFDVDIEPKNFTGTVHTKDAVIEYAGGWKKRNGSYWAVYINGKLVDGGVNAGNYAYENMDNKNEYESTCAVKSINQVKLLSIGKPVIATPGIKLDIKENEEKQ